jgi:hypothetical protein
MSLLAKTRIAQVVAPRPVERFVVRLDPDAGQGIKFGQRPGCTGLATAVVQDQDVDLVGLGCLVAQAPHRAPQHLDLVARGDDDENATGQGGSGRDRRRFNVSP